MHDHDLDLIAAFIEGRLVDETEARSQIEVIGKSSHLVEALTGNEDFEVFVDINDWRRQKEEKLKKMAISIAEQVAQSAEEQPIYNLKSSERRVIHTVLAEHPKVSTVSEGEGPDRHLIVKPKSAES